MSRHRATLVRPRYGRISVLAASVLVTAVAVLGGSGLLPATVDGETGTAIAAVDLAADREVSADWLPAALLASSLATAATAPAPAAETADPSLDTTLPAGSGEGRRVVFSESRQRVWLVRGNESVLRTYLVSGSVYDNLEPGTYEVYSRSEDATGIEDSGTMKYFVRFTQGDTGAAIGFHDIPVDDGEPVQTVADLGTPLSHGCIRQRRADARVLWDFAPLGTTVVVTA